MAQSMKKEDIKAQVLQQKIEDKTKKIRNGIAKYKRLHEERKKAVKKEPPLYYKFIGETTPSFTKGKIYKIVNPNRLEESFNFITNTGARNGYSPENNLYFTPSTLDKYLIHEQRKKQREIKKAPITLFGMEIRHNPKAHKFSVAMAMVGLNTDIPSADLILRLLDVIDEMGDKFDISTAVDLKLEVANEYDAIKEEFEKINNKNN